MQTLARGSTISDRYGALGGHTGPMVAPPSKISAFIFGLPGDGKSNLEQSNPNAFIFNFDSSSTTTPDPRAVIFPGVNPINGRLVGDAGRDVVLTMDLVNSKIEILKELAAKDQPRPDTVVFDSLSTWIYLLVQWIPLNAKKLGIATENKDEWKYLDGRAAWDTLYTTIISTITNLRNAGYGVHVIGHIVNAKIPLNENQFVMRPELTITEGFWKRLYPLFELSALVYRDQVTESFTEEVRDVVRDEVKISKRTKTRSVTKHFLTVSKLELAGIAKSRVRLPERIELPESGAWEAFEKAYIEAIK